MAQTACETVRAEPPTTPLAGPSRRARPRPAGVNGLQIDQALGVEVPYPASTDAALIAVMLLAR